MDKCWKHYAKKQAKSFQNLVCILSLQHISNQSSHILSVQQSDVAGGTTVDKSSRSTLQTIILNDVCDDDTDAI